jgi:hypothetical protein
MLEQEADDRQGSGDEEKHFGFQNGRHVASQPSGRKRSIGGKSGISIPPVTTIEEPPGDRGAGRSPTGIAAAPCLKSVLIEVVLS